MLPNLELITCRHKCNIMCQGGRVLNAFANFSGHACDTSRSPGCTTLEKKIPPPVFHIPCKAQQHHHESLHFHIELHFNGDSMCCNTSWSSHEIVRCLAVLSWLLCEKSLLNHCVWLLCNPRHKPLMFAVCTWEFCQGLFCFSTMTPKHSLNTASSNWRPPRQLGNKTFS